MRGPVQFLLDANGRPQYAVLPIEDYWALTGDTGPANHAQADRHDEPKDPLGRDAPPADLPPEVEQAIAQGLHPIAAWRSYRGLTQEILAGWIGFEEEDIAYFEENDAVPTVEILQMIANALDVPIQALLAPEKD